MQIREANDTAAWDAFLGAQPWSPFLQSWTMGEVYHSIGQEPLRLMAEENGTTLAIAFGHVVSARRGKHIAVPYGPVIESSLPEDQKREVFEKLADALKIEGKKRGAAFIRISPWMKPEETPEFPRIRSPLHMLAEHVWLLPLIENGKLIMENEILASMRSTTRNLIRRAAKDGVTVGASANPNRDIDHFLRLHEETRKRHHFTPYTDQFFRTQVEKFTAKGQCTLYLARHEGAVIASSIHMHAFGETSYHHGASEHSKVPASYLLQWTAICDAMKRGDKVYNFWGIAPLDASGEPQKGHPFAGVSLFKTGFGGEVLNLTHCFDLPISKKYWLTYAVETFRKWRRGF